MIKSAIVHTKLAGKRKKASYSLRGKFFSQFNMALNGFVFKNTPPVLFGHKRFAIPKYHYIPVCRIFQYKKIFGA
jgi:hypothetical protein